MTTRLITFLGRPPKDQGSYRTTRYRFADDDHPTTLAFFGWALHERLRPDHIIVLGTNGSAWDHLFERDINLDQREEERLALIDAVAQKRVTQAQLDALAPLLSEALRTKIDLVITPYAQTHDEQIEFLQCLAKFVEKRDEVHLDVTHGLRHLPMLALLAALYLRTARSVHIKNIWYGAFDPDTQEAPVFDLTGLLSLADRIYTFAQFDKDGDYAVFEPILNAAGLPPEGCAKLREASYFENILNVGEATGALRRARRIIETSTLSAEGRLLLPAIEQRLAWLDEERQFEKQTRLARNALARRDYLRATLYAYEAVITRLCQRERVDITDFDRREEQRKAYEARARQDRDTEWDSYCLLKNLRNQVAHGNRGTRGEVQNALLREDNMRRELERLLSMIERGELPSGS
jgi:CRISPR-associated Csx2 family protein